jgi:hypothetical protein
MQNQNEPRSVPLDLTRNTETTRRELYERLVRIQRLAPEPPILEGVAPASDGEEREPAPVYDPEASELVVFHAFGRWFATWVNRDAPEDVPEHLRREVVRIQPSPESPEGILLYEV